MQRRCFLTVGMAALVAGCAARGPVRMPPGTTLIVVRHGERHGEDLNDAGRVRARDLVTALKGIPLDRIYSPGIQRNLDTAAPLSAARGLPITRRPQENPAPVLMRESASQTVVWIGNKGNIAAIWDTLSLPEPAPLNYGDLHIVRSDAKGRVTVERRRFGTP